MRDEIKNAKELTEVRANVAFHSNQTPATSKDSSLIVIRDNAILQIGYFGALRRSEIINIHYIVYAEDWQRVSHEAMLPSKLSCVSVVGNKSIP